MYLYLLNLMDFSSIFLCNKKTKNVFIIEKESSISQLKDVNKNEVKVTPFINNYYIIDIYKYKLSNNIDIFSMKDNLRSRSIYVDKKCIYTIIGNKKIVLVNKIDKLEWSECTEPFQHLDTLPLTLNKLCKKILHKYIDKKYESGSFILWIST